MGPWQVDGLHPSRAVMQAVTWERNAPADHGGLPGIAFSPPPDSQYGRSGGGGRIQGMVESL